MEPRTFFPREKFGEVRSVTSLTMGMSGAAVYSVTTDAGEFVLRVHRGDRSSWERAIGMQSVASKLGSRRDARCATSVKYPG